MSSHPELETMSVPEAGRHLGLCRNSAYLAARNGEIPVVRLGRKLRVPVSALEKMLAGEAEGQEDKKTTVTP